ncbi:MAG TPA: type II secretion system ATPase GspE [Sedimentisphaerales bacterium]|nr:type II secretion system ATPase GspE [Sedimentisphaerales bacterium]
MIRLFPREPKMRVTSRPSAVQDICSASGVTQGLSSLYSPQQDSAPAIRDIADVLLEMGRIKTEDLAQIREAQQKKQGSDVAAIIRKMAIVSPNDLLTARASLCGFEFRRITPDKVDRAAFEKLNIEYIKSHRIMPIVQEGGKLLVATSEPADVFVIDDVKRQVEMNVEVVVCPEEDIAAVCEALKQNNWEFCVDDIIKDISQGEVEFVADDEQETEDLEKIAGESPIIKFVNYLISHAIREGASDIHIEPKEKQTKIRYRIDGVLSDAMQPPAGMHAAVVSRLKIMSNLDISERRLPQDGRIAAIVGGRNIDLRVSTLPTTHGEKVVIRVLDGRSIMLGLEQLGLAPDTLATLRQEIHRPHGIILVTGPTGSGKTTTLYSSLQEMDSQTMNISTVEDPVEYHLGTCNQIQVNEKIGMTFAAALRSLLRQDPDIIMVGEIRDGETARIAVQAALTGHLVLSTLHTNDAPSSITRLVDIGIEPYLIAASLNSIMAQRLVRRICQHCKTQFELTPKIAHMIQKAGIAPEEVFHGAGCEHCRKTGYAGRAGIYEMLTIDDKFRDIITQDPSISNMRRAFRESGQKSLYDDGMLRVKSGMTTIEEVLRVTEISASAEHDVFEENVVYADAN